MLIGIIKIEQKPHSGKAFFDDILETLWFSGFILAKGCVDIAGIALRYLKTKMPLVYYIKRAFYTLL